jgi:hypothetical protein
MMNYRLQLSPISGTRQTGVGVHPGKPSGTLPENPEDARFFRSWLVYDSDLESGTQACINWNTVLGITLAITVSVGFWVGAALMIARLWK